MITTMRRCVDDNDNEKVSRTCWLCERWGEEEEEEPSRKMFHAWLNT